MFRIETVTQKTAIDERTGEPVMRRIEHADGRLQLDALEAGKWRTIQITPDQAAAYQAIAGTDAESIDPAGDPVDPAESPTLLAE